MILTKIRTASPENIIAYIQGNLRYKLYYSKFAFLIRPHIREQIEARITSMDKQCFEEGQCKMCGCQTTALQMANKACDKPCYPSMLDKRDWRDMEDDFAIFDEATQEWWSLENGKFVIDKLFPDDEGLAENEYVLLSTDLKNHKEF